MRVCERCGATRAVGHCCQHLARGLATFDDAQRGADLVCTLCKPDDAVHPVCGPCRKAVRAHNVAVVDRARPFGLVKREPFLKVIGVDRPKLLAVQVGDFVKVGLSKLPLTEPRWLESLWVKVEARRGDQLRGVVDNQPELFTAGELALGASLEFSVENVVDVMPGAKLAERPHQCPLCLGEGRELDDGDEKLLKSVRSFGVHVLKVMADEEGPAFGYTVGLHHRFGHPEVIAFGLDLQTLHGVLNRLGGALAEGKAPALDRLLEGTRCRLSEPSAAGVRRDYFGYASWFYRGDDFPIRQLVWPGCEPVL